MSEDDKSKKLELEVRADMGWDDVNDVWNKVARFFNDNETIDEVRLRVSDLNNIDSLSLNYLVTLRGFARERGGDFVLADVGDEMYKVIKMMQLQDKFTIIRKPSDDSSNKG